MDYRVVFDVSEQTPDWQFPAFGLLFIGVGLVLVLGRNRAAQNIRATILPWAMLAFSLIWIGGALASVLGGHSRAVQALKSGAFGTAVGSVENFQAETMNHKRETFTVSGLRFSYSRYIISPGFRQTAAEGGPLRNGVPVRIAYVGNEILKLEIESTTPYAGPAPRFPPVMLLIPIFAVALWIGSLFAFAFLGGWRSLANEFPASSSPVGTCYGLQSLRWGFFSHYNNCIDVTLGESGIHLLPMILFRAGHAPILIPWEAVESYENANLFFQKATRLHLRHSQRKITFYGQAAVELLRRAESPGPKERSARDA
jgi:hypothetical protein